MASHRVQRGIGSYTFSFLEFEDIEVVIKELILFVVNAFIVKEVIPYLYDIVIIVDMAIHKRILTTL